MQVREEAERPRTPLVAFFSILLKAGSLNEHFLHNQKHGLDRNFLGRQPGDAVRLVHLSVPRIRERREGVDSAENLEWEGGSCGWH